ncbi:hypothetical protein JNM05_12345 [bacterium]|nr:hypothetical protein [bacterium]MBL7996154.1 hypothetical protein [bacterium]
MTFSEVKKMCEDIQYYAGHKLKPDDEYEFRKLYNRVKDEEDLDSMSLKKLQAIYDKYLKK